MRSGFAAVVGRPNVGKSTLVNALVGSKVAIVSEKPQTTRHRIAAVLNRPEVQIVFLDTPGFQRPRDELGSFMMRQVHAALEGVDAVLFVVDGQQPPGAGDRRVAHTLRHVEAPRLLVVNKIDLAPEPPLEAYRGLADWTEVFLVSAQQGVGIEALIERLISLLPEGPTWFPPDRVTDRPEEFLMGELIREQVFALTREEIPHATSVEVERTTPREGGRLYVAATVWVERESQKGIVIGRGGAMLREIGTRARREIEGVLGSPLYLELRVKVKEGWRNRPGSLQTLGYREE